MEGAGCPALHSSIVRFRPGAELDLSPYANPEQTRQHNHGSSFLPSPKLASQALPACPHAQAQQGGLISVIQICRYSCA